MTTFNHADLIDQAAIEAASAHFVRLLQRKLAAPAAIAHAEGAVRTAEAQYRTAVADGNVSKARKTLAEAKVALQDAIDARDILEHAAAQAQAAVPAVRRAAHLPLVRRLLDEQTELAREADAIRAALADVEARWAQNMAHLHNCHLASDEMASIAALPPSNGPQTPRAVRTEAEQATVMASLNLE